MFSSSRDSKIHKYSERFSKIDLNSKGYKLAFCDLNVIVNWAKCSKDEQEKIISYFKSNCLRPVLNQFLIAELLKGLKNKDDENVRNKKAAIAFLEKLQPIWVLNSEFILAQEYLNTDSNASNAYNLKIFSDYPLRADNNNSPSIRSYNAYENLLNHYYIPHESIIESEGCLEAYIEDIVKNELGFWKQAFDDGKKQNVDLTNKEKKKLDEDSNKHTEEERSREIVVRILQKYTTLNDLEYDTVWKNVSNASLMQTPYNHLTDYIYYEIDLKNGLRESKKRKGDFIDHSYMGIALSYCDCLITSDIKLLKKVI